jgi:hypothetical protein
MDELKKFPGAARQIPAPIAYPSDYGLALAVSALLRDYDMDGAVNRLIEMAERISNGDDPYSWVLARQRVERDRI